MLFFPSTAIPLLKHMYCVLYVLCRKGAEIINCRCLLWNVRAWEESALSRAPGNEASCLRAGAGGGGEEWKKDVMRDWKPTGEVEQVLSNSCSKAGTLGHNEVMPLLALLEHVRLWNMQAALFYELTSWWRNPGQRMRGHKLINSCWLHHYIPSQVCYFVCSAQQSY